MSNLLLDFLLYYCAIALVLGKTCAYFINKSEQRKKQAPWQAAWEYELYRTNH